MQNIYLRFFVINTYLDNYAVVLMLRNNAQTFSAENSTLHQGETFALDKAGICIQK